MVVICGSLPYSGGVLVLFTRNVLWLGIAGLISCILASSARYAVARVRNPDYATSMLITDLALFPIYYTFAAVTIFYIVLRHR
jgi:hypothetical protein